jgi:hypothetical protein
MDVGVFAILDTPPRKAKHLVYGFPRFLFRCFGHNSTFILFGEPLEPLA